MSNNTNAALSILIPDSESGIDLAILDRNVEILEQKKRKVVLNQTVC